MKSNRSMLSRICLMHYVKLVYRSILFIAATVLYVVSRVCAGGGFFDDPRFNIASFAVLGVAFVVYVAEMISRFFPSRLESMGCQKQFKRNFEPTGESKPSLTSWKGTLAVVLSWIALNGAFGVLYYTHVIDASILILISLAYGVCDLICILFFCPFQTWMMKNRCCATCRIYNWDFAMMFTPLVFILLVPTLCIYTWTLLGLALVLLLRWEITRFRHPERFSRSTNACLSCGRCEEKLCHCKPQLKFFWRTNKKRFKN